MNAAHCIGRQTKRLFFTAVLVVVINAYERAAEGEDFAKGDEARGYGLLVIGDWLWAMGYWLLAIGYGL